MRQPRILVIQDISASCRISMNVALPVLSCLNNGVNILPTALLSTHTGSSFPDYTFLDLTGELKKIVAHWRELDLKFDGILIGYLGSLEQISLVEEIIEHFLKDEGISVLDPVMGDHGILYSGFDDEYISEMRQLCGMVSVLIPNMTEASFLLQKEYSTIPYTEEMIHEYLQELSHLHNGKSVLTGISYDGENIGAACFDQEKHEYASALAPIQPAHFDGTGDLFSSVVAGYLFQGKSLAFATKTAVEYINRVIVRTLESGMDLKYGIQFETDLPYLIERLYQ
ncbi:pyridoxamine kinase [Jeotgalibaca sp. MA1X17-3]|uniref:pyridoxamine kinase n=1 Tax=Jeotgalibaca sp. MA1X17-3 TaxID=2908211 RepID=UPI001F36460E|nr:pyridoxamine kinase [Jeotgalibaca sp. MA1X17-3]UJF16361.1 pyridoxamine kinase [Jeotgalibaca sp. MA1X17-3]